MSVVTNDYEQSVTHLRGVLENNKMAPLQILVVMICFTLNMIDGMDVVLMSYTAPVLAQEWSIEPAVLGAVFSAALIGMTLGCLFIAPYADVIGRRKMILFAVTTIGAGMLFSGWSQSLHQLVAARVVTGLGVGAILASMATMTSEFATRERRNLCVSFLQAGYPIGAVATGFASAWLIPEFGWRVMFEISGVVTLLMVPVVYFFMPESPEFLLKRQPGNALDNINRILVKLKAAPLVTLPAAPADSARTSVKKLFTDGRARPTLLLWGGVFFGFFTLYFIISWIPKIAVDAGLPLEQGIFAGAAYNLGSFTGSILLGWISVRFGLQKMIFTFFVLAAVTLMVFGNVSMGVSMILLTAYILGVTLNGGFNGFWPTSARLYPTEIRATGVGWAVGAGRAGAVIGPFAGGYLLQSGAGLSTTFIVFTIPVVLAGLLTLLIKDSDFAN
ncbi:MFS transporter [Alteromonas sp. RKMC-009]|uniref:MFS transporter n=1 Tax=Alteromonas sp. RKMC-009 TaxID=2267264 RepID=UPI000E69D00A|nr:MFS transporter [Alteromonas sp. RKMC-009]AYA65586.1 MFS transporter [Alteromonas sp. RKMC-009]